MFYKLKKYRHNAFYITVVVIMFSIIRFGKSPTLGPEVEQREVLKVNSEGRGSCRALFTITEVPQPDTITSAHLLNYSLTNFTSNSNLLGHRGTPSHSYRNWDVTVAARRVRNLLQQRSSTSGASTTNYRSLAALLPTLLSFQDNSTENDKDNQRKEGQTPILVTTSRIGTMGGVLPYVPCVIAPYDDPASITACFRKRLEEKDSLWIVFMGDSKMRILFFEILLRTEDEYHYIIKRSNVTQSLVETLEEHINIHEDMEATTSAAPHLLITYRFRTFEGEVLSKMRELPEIQELEGWARGEDVPPHLLIVGYTSWLMQLNSFDYTHDQLALLMDMHRVVVPLLEKISHKSRVLVVAQSRYRSYAITSKLANWRVAFGDGSSEWSEMAFLYYQRQYRENRWPRTTPRPRLPSIHFRGEEVVHPLFSLKKQYRKACSEQNIHSNCTKPQAKVSQNQNLIVKGKKSPLGTGQDEDFTHRRKILEPERGQVQDTISTRTTPQSKINQQQVFTSSRVKTVPEASGKQEKLLKMVKSKPKTSRDYLVPTEDDSGVWWWDSGLPMSVGEVDECEDLYRRGLKSHSLYKSEYLKCDDSHHAAKVTLRDMVTMLFNLLCNSVLGTNGSVCCT